MERCYDAIVIGGGLSGLTAALHLQQAGLRTALLEKSRRFGGLCGAMVVDGYEFAIACNDFGLGLERELRLLEVQVELRRVKSHYHFERGLLSYPMDLRSLLRFLAAPGDLGRFAAAVYRRRRQPDGPTVLGPLAEETLRSPLLRDFVASLGFFTGTAPDQVTLEGLLDVFSKEYAYGYNQYVVPVHGPQRLVEQMVAAYRAAGGTALPETECSSVDGDGAGKRVRTNRGEYESRHLVSSLGRWDCYPPASRPGLALSMLLLAVDAALPYPEGVHTIAWFPAGVREWMTQLDAGTLPDAFGFNLFRNGFAPGRGQYTISVYFYTPRGIDALDPRRAARIEQYVLEQADRLLPGLKGAIRYERLVFPKEFTQRHGLSSRPHRLMAPLGFPKPDAYDPKTDVHYAGNSVQPPGEHAGQAVLSGRLAAQAVIEAVSRRPGAAGRP